MLTDVAIKAAKTFVQAALASPLIVSLTSADISSLQTMGLAGLAAAISFLQNTLLAWSRG